MPLSRTRYITITTRLTLWYLAIFGGIIIAAAVVMYSAFEATERSAIDAELTDYGDFLISQIDTRGMSISEIFDALEVVTTRANLQFRSMRFFLSNRDSIVYENTPQAQVDPMIDSLRADVPRHRGAPFTTIGLDGDDVRILTCRVPGSDEVSLIVVAPLGRFDATMARLRDILLLVVPLSLVAAGAGGWFIARRALAPVAEITATAAAISSSNLHRRVSAGGSRDELAQLASTFNDMIARLERTFNSQQRFIADASHDLRTPLTVLRAEIDLLAASELKDPETAEAVRRIARGIEGLQRLTNDLLLLARADADQLLPELEETRLDELVVECAAGVRRLAAARDISLRVDVSEPIEVEASPALLARAIANVLENAVKYSPEGSSVRLELRRVGDRAVVTVTDQGPGISAEDLPRVFDRFYRGDRTRSTPGTGLGLAIVRVIVRAHRGSISIEPGESAGTCVSISLPASSPGLPGLEE